MKKIFYGLFLVLFGIVLSCKQEIQTTDGNTSHKDRVIAFLDNYYHSAYTFGRKKTTVVDNKPLVVREILLSDKNHKGYVATPLGKDKILYFADINYSTSNIYIVDNTTGHTDRFHFNPRNPATGNVARPEQMQNFDFFDNLNNSNTEGRKFFGKECFVDIRPNSCLRYCYYYVFWILVYTYDPEPCN